MKSGGETFRTALLTPPSPAAITQENQRRGRRWSVVEESQLKNGEG